MDWSKVTRKDKTREKLHEIQDTAGRAGGSEAGGMPQRTQDTSRTG